MPRGIEIQVGDFEGSILRTGRRHNPHEFSRMKMPEELRNFAARFSVETFAQMVNHGHTFQDALLAIYLTGCEHGVMATKEQSECQA